MARPKALGQEAWRQEGAELSDTPRGPGSWQASDGRWYPAELHPSASGMTQGPPAASDHTQATYPQGPPEQPTTAHRDKSPFRWIVLAATAVVVALVVGLLVGSAGKVAAPESMTQWGNQNKSVLIRIGHSFASYHACVNDANCSSQTLLGDCFALNDAVRAGTSIPGPPSDGQYWSRALSLYSAGARDCVTALTGGPTGLGATGLAYINAGSENFKVFLEALALAYGRSASG
jgi:hypothetical protein